MTYVSAIDKNGIQRMGVCIGCYFPIDCDYCTPTFITCENNHKENTAMILNPSWTRRLAVFKDEILTIKELVEWCEKHGYHEATCPGDNKNDG